MINNKFTIIKDKAGKINYETGTVEINDLKTSYYGNYVSIYMSPQNKDIIVSQDKILLIDVNDVNINVIQTQK
jgi:hypothetical protein